MAGHTAWPQFMFFSAGLRVLLKFKKTADRPVIINNVSSEIFDIFDVTGFASIFDVRKKMREIDASGCEIIGRGGNGTVYRLDDLAQCICPGGRSVCQYGESSSVSPA